MSWSDTAQIYKQRKPRESPLWQLLNEHFDEFEERYDELFFKEYGFYHPVISHVVRKFLECGDLHQGRRSLAMLAYLPVFVVRIATTNTFWHSHVVAAGSALHVMLKKLFSSQRIFRTMYCTLSPTGSMFSASLRSSAGIFALIVNCSANWRNVRQQVSPHFSKRY